MSGTSILAAFSLLLFSPSLDAQATRVAVSADEAAERIRAVDLEERIWTLAHDSMRGRDTPSPELEQTARYVADRFRAFGLRPAVGNGYLQPYPLTIVEPGEAGAQEAVLVGPAGEHRLDPRRDVIALPAGHELQVSGPLLALELDDAATDVLDRVVVIRVTPATLQAALVRTRELVSGRLAAGAVLALDADADYQTGVRRFFSARRLSLGEPDPFRGPVVIVDYSALPDRLGSALKAGGPLPSGWSARLRTTASVRSARAHNVVGWIEGSDPELREEYVVVTAHMDHVGVGRPVDGDSIYNGADDNASGTAAVMELAEAFGAMDPSPRRSVVLMTVSGEEKGLLGSEWYAENPIFPLERTVANVNIDMIGRNWEDTVVAIGLEKSSLGPTLLRVAEERRELGLTVIDDPWPHERFFFRSDHYNFARRGVPALFFFSGVHQDYHRPSDTPDKVKFDKTERIVRLIFHLGVEVANADGRPEWDPEAYRTVVEGPGR